MTARIELSRRARRDLRAFRGTLDVRRILEGLDRLAAGAGNLDVKALQGAVPWLRLRVGEFRVIYRPLTAEEVQALPGASTAGFLVARVVNRRDLDRAIESL